MFTSMNGGEKGLKPVPAQIPGELLSRPPIQRRPDPHPDQLCLHHDDTVPLGLEATDQVIGIFAILERARLNAESGAANRRRGRGRPARRLWRPP